MSLKTITLDIDRLNRKFVTLGLSPRHKYTKSPIPTWCQTCRETSKLSNYSLIAVCVLLSIVIVYSDVWRYAAGVRCLLPNNYLIWEATRPISDCAYCQQTEGATATIVRNVSAGSFAAYAYTSWPVVLKGAALAWPAITHFTLDYFRTLYAPYTNDNDGDDDVCQFLHFTSNFDTLTDVLALSSSAAEEWYVGWANCHPDILAAMREHYPARPTFLPRDAELPSRDYVFMGRGVGAGREAAAMHIDFIGRFMWQAQLRAAKRWRLLPINECEVSCGGRDAAAALEFTAEPGDVVLVDTRLWYHATAIQPTGREHDLFSLSIQSEYG